MTIEINTHTITKIQTTYDSLDELSQIEKFYFAVLCKIFLDKPALIITVAPGKKYSLGYDIAPFSELRMGKAKFLVNKINSCSSSVLTEISQSEEFNRGLLILITGEKILSENPEEFIKYVHNDIGLENLAYEIVHCENDGKSLCLYNAQLSKEDLLFIAPLP